MLCSCRSDRGDLGLREGAARDPLPGGVGAPRLAQASSPVGSWRFRAGGRGPLHTCLRWPFSFEKQGWIQSAGTVLCGQCHTRGQCPSCQPVPHYTSGKGPLEVKVPEWRQRVNDREAPPPPCCCCQQGNSVSWPCQLLLVLRGPEPSLPS